MKHPALARVFSVVLAILGLLLLMNGLRGFQKNEREHGERLAYAEKFSGRIENYSTLQAQMDRSADYTEVMAALDTLLATHEKAASQHKTDTAIYSATKGGLRMGEDLIVTLRAQMEELRGQLKSANSRKTILEGLLAELIANNRSRMPWLDTLTNAAGGYAAESYLAANRLTVLSTQVRNLMEMEPIPQPESEGVPEVPGDADLGEPPVAPVMDESYMQAVQEAMQRSPEEYAEAVAAYQEAVNRYGAELGEYYERLAAYEYARQTRELAGMQASQMQQYYNGNYEQAHAAWEAECARMKNGADFGTPTRDIRRLSGILASIVRQVNEQAASLVAGSGGILPGLEDLLAVSEATASRLEELSAVGLSSLSNEEFVRAAERAADTLNTLGDAFFCVTSTLSDPAALIAEVLEELHITENLVKYVDVMLARADQAIQAQLEILWYQMGELDKDALRLEAEKLGLDREAALLGKETLQADELRDLRSRHNSARFALLAVSDVKEKVTAGAELTESARAYLASYEAETGRLYSGKRLINALAVAAGIAAAAGIPAAYELIKKRFFLLAPPLVCLLCAAGAEGLNLHLGLGQMYAALFTAIFALLDLLIVAPKARRPQYSGKHGM